MASWPTTLPWIVQAAGYAESLKEMTVRTQMELGPPKVRRRFSNASRAIKASLLLLNDQAKILENFFYDDCNCGATPFTWQSQRGFGDTNLAGNSIDPADDQNVSDTQLLLKYKTYRFLTPPAFTTGGGGVWLAALDLEEMP